MASTSTLPTAPRLRAPPRDARPLLTYGNAVAAGGGAAWLIGKGAEKLGSLF